MNATRIYAWPLLGFCDSNQVQDHEEDESSVSQKCWMRGCGDMRRARMRGDGVLRGARRSFCLGQNGKRMPQSSTRGCGALRFLREVGFGTFLAGYSLFLTVSFVFS